MATKTKKTPKDKYKPNQFVVHPHHGAAKVIRKAVSYTHLTLPTIYSV